MRKLLLLSIFALGLVYAQATNVHIVDAMSTVLVGAYTAPSTAACTNTVATDAGFTAIVYGPTADVGGMRMRFFVATSLTASTPYYYKVACGSDVTGQYTTPAALTAEATSYHTTLTPPPIITAPAKVKILYGTAPGSLTYNQTTACTVGPCTVQVGLDTGNVQKDSVLYQQHQWLDSNNVVLATSLVYPVSVHQGGGGSSSHSLLTWDAPLCPYTMTGPNCQNWVNADPPVIGATPGSITTDPETGLQIMRITASGFQGALPTETFGLPDWGAFNMWNANHTKLLVYASSMDYYCVGIVNDDPATPDVDEWALDLNACATGNANHKIPTAYRSGDAFHSTDPCLIVNQASNKIGTFNVCTGQVGADLLVPGTSPWWDGPSSGIRSIGEAQGTVCGSEPTQGVGRHIACRYHGGPIKVFGMDNQTINGVSVPVYRGGVAVDLTGYTGGVHSLSVSKDGEWASWENEGPSPQCAGASCDWAWRLSDDWINVADGATNTFGGGHYSYGNGGLNKIGGSDGCSPEMSSTLGAKFFRFDDWRNAASLIWSPCTGMRFDGGVNHTGENHASWNNNYPDAHKDQYPFIVGNQQGGYDLEPSTTRFLNELVAFLPPADGVSRHGNIYRIGQTFDGVGQYACKNRTQSPNASRNGRYVGFQTSWSPNAFNGGPGQCASWQSNGTSYIPQRKDLFVWRTKR